MKRREIQRLVSGYVAPSFPDLDLVDDMLVRWDGDPIVRGFIFDRSQMHKAMVRVDVFAQPLFVPAEDVSLSVAQTLGDFLFDDAAEEAEVMAEVLRRAEHEGRALLEGASDCSSLADTVLEMPDDRMDERLGLEIRAYCLLWSGRIDEAAAELDRAIELLRQFEVEYELEALTRVTQVRQALDRSEAEARALLADWARQTTQALKLTG